MTTHIYALYDDPDIARKAGSDLAQIGLGQDAITLIGRDDDPQLSDHLRQHGISSENARLYAEAVRRGRVLLDARVENGNTDKVLSILERHGARNVKDLAGELQQQSGESLPIAEEKMEIGKKTITGGKAVHAKVKEQPVEESVRLRRENVEIEHRDADRDLSPEEADQAFQERSIEMKGEREVPVVEKQARVTGEVHLSKSQEEVKHTERDKVRRTEIVEEDKKQRDKE